MGDRDTLLANTLQSPADDTARLVLADWLEEHDEEAFGRFLRAGVLAAQFQARDQLDDPAYSHFQTIAEVTGEGAPARWLAALGMAPTPLSPGDWEWTHTRDQVALRIGGTAGLFTRGMLSELE